MSDDTVDLLMNAMWKAYVATGADTDGNDGWRCSPEMAAVSLLDAVFQLRRDYDEACNELGGMI